MGGGVPLLYSTLLYPTLLYPTLEEHFPNVCIKLYIFLFLNASNAFFLVVWMLKEHFIILQIL